MCGLGFFSWGGGQWQVTLHLKKETVFDLFSPILIQCGFVHGMLG